MSVFLIFLAKLVILLDLLLKFVFEFIFQPVLLYLNINKTYLNMKNKKMLRKFMKDLKRKRSFRFAIEKNVK